jgi:hypothetical protein
LRALRAGRAPCGFAAGRHCAWKTSWWFGGVAGCEVWRTKFRIVKSSRAKISDASVVWGIAHTSHHYIVYIHLARWSKHVYQFRSERRLWQIGNLKVRNEERSLLKSRLELEFNVAFCMLLEVYCGYGPEMSASLEYIRGFVQGIATDSYEKLLFHACMTASIVEF